MADIAQGAHVDLVLTANQGVRVSTAGVATVTGAYGAPVGPAVITAGFQDFGPYGVPAKLAAVATTGTMSYRQLPVETEAGTVPDATAEIKGKLSFAGALAGSTADSQKVFGIANAPSFATSVGKGVPADFGQRTMRSVSSAAGGDFLAKLNAAIAASSAGDDVLCDITDPQVISGNIVAKSGVRVIFPFGTQLNSPTRRIWDPSGVTDFEIWGLNSLGISLAPFNTTRFRLSRSYLRVGGDSGNADLNHALRIASFGFTTLGTVVDECTFDQVYDCAIIDYGTGTKVTRNLFKLVGTGHRLQGDSSGTLFANNIMEGGSGAFLEWDVLGSSGIAGVGSILNNEFRSWAAAANDGRRFAMSVVGNTGQYRTGIVVRGNVFACVGSVAPEERFALELTCPGSIAEGNVFTGWSGRKSDGSTRYNGTAGVLSGSGVALYSTGGANISVVGNTFYRCRTPIGLYNAAQNLVIKRNHFVNCEDPWGGVNLGFAASAQIHENKSHYVIDETSTTGDMDGNWVGGLKLVSLPTRGVGALSIRGNEALVHGILPTGSTMKFYGSVYDTQAIGTEGYAGLTVEDQVFEYSANAGADATRKTATKAACIGLYANQARAFAGIKHLRCRVSGAAYEVYGADAPGIVHADSCTSDDITQTYPGWNTSAMGGFKVQATNVDANAQDGGGFFNPSFTQYNTTLGKGIVRGGGALTADSDHTLPTLSNAEAGFTTQVVRGWDATGNFTITPKWVLRNGTVQRTFPGLTAAGQAASFEWQGTTIGWVMLAHSGGRAFADSLAYASTVTPDWPFGTGSQKAISALTGNITVANPSAMPRAGVEVSMAFVQDATGGRTVTWGSGYKFPTAWSNSGNTAAARSAVSFVSDGTYMWARGANAWA